MPPKTPERSKYAPFYDCPPVVKEFLDYMLTIRGRSVRTVDSYYIDLRTFLRFLKQYRQNALDPETFQLTPIQDVSLETITAITLSDVYSFLNFMSTSFGNNANTRSRKISCLRSFYKYLSTKTLYLSDNPLKNLDLPSKRKSVPKYLTLEESNQLLETAEESDAKSSARDFCILTLFLNCGMRLSELCNINLEDIREGTVKLLGKGNKERVIFLNQACQSAIDAYLEESKKTRRLDHALFVSKKGLRLTPRRVEQIVGDRLKAAGLSGAGYSPHKLRHTAATLLYQYGEVDVRILKEILGHTSLNTTEIYTHISDRQLEKAADKSPLAGHKSKKPKPEDPGSEGE